MIESSAWMERSLCREEDPELWHPGDGASTVRNLQRAVAICHQCPVERECLEWALDIEDRPNVLGSYGVFGGLLAPERKAILAERARARKERGEPDPESLAHLPERARPELELAPVIAARLESGMKRCPRCDTDKPLTDYNIERGRSDGHAAFCRECHRSYIRERRRAARKVSA